MQKFHNEDQAFPLYFLIFFSEPPGMKDKQHVEMEGVLRRGFKCNNKQFVFNRETFESNGLKLVCNVGRSK